MEPGALSLIAGSTGTVSQSPVGLSHQIRMKHGILPNPQMQEFSSNSKVLYENPCLVPENPITR